MVHVLAVALFALFQAVIAEATHGTLPLDNGFTKVPPPELRFVDDLGRRLDQVDGALGSSQRGRLSSIAVRLPDDVIIEVDMRANDDLFPAGYKEMWVDANGQLHVVDDPIVERDCYYISVRTKPMDPVVAMSTCKNKIVGSIVTIEGEMYEFRHQAGDLHGLARHLLQSNSSRGDDVLPMPTKTYVNSSKVSSPTTRSSSTRSTTATLGETPASGEKLYIEVLAVADEVRLGMFDSTDELSDSNIRIVNQIAAHYSNTNWSGVDISVSLSGQITFTTNLLDLTAQSDGSYASSDLLVAFNEFRREYIDSLPSHDVAHLLSGRDLEGSVIGLGYVGGACDDDSQCEELNNANNYCNVNGCCVRIAGSISQQTVSYEVFGGETAAHEIGHQLGFQHDGTEGCASSGYIMQASASVSAASESLTFSSCSIATFVERFETSYETSGYQPYVCFLNVPNTTSDSLTTFSTSATSPSYSSSVLVRIVSVLGVWLALTI